MVKIFKLFAICFAVLVLLNLSCSTNHQDEMVNWKGQNDRSDIVFLFKQGLSSKQKEDFNKSVLHKPYIKNYGAELRDGVSDLMVGVIVGEYEGGLINFSPSATAEQKKQMFDEIERSDFISRVFKDAIPNKISIDQNFKTPK